MAFPILSKPDLQRGIYLEVISVPQSSGDHAFNSSLLFKTNGHENHTLTLCLKIFLKPVKTFGVSRLPYVDFNKTLFFYQ